MASEGGVGATQMQLRQKDERTALRYNQSPVEERKEALEKIG